MGVAGGDGDGEVIGPARAGELPKPEDDTGVTTELTRGLHFSAAPTDDGTSASAATSLLRSKKSAGNEPTTDAGNRRGVVHPPAIAIAISCKPLLANIAQSTCTAVATATVYHIVVLLDCRYLLVLVGTIIY